MGHIAKNTRYSTHMSHLYAAGNQNKGSYSLHMELNFALFASGNCLQYQLFTLYGKRKIFMTIQKIEE